MIGCCSTSLQFRWLGQGKNNMMKHINYDNTKITNLQVVIASTVHMWYQLKSRLNFLCEGM